MEKEQTAASAESRPEEIVFASHEDGFFKTDPGWADVPKLASHQSQEINEIVVDVVPGLLTNGASQRYAVITALGEHYVQYRSAGCSPKRSRLAAIKRTRARHNLGESAVYEHIRSLPINGIDEDTTAITPHLEQVNTAYWERQDEEARVILNLCVQLRRVLSTIAVIDDIPGIRPSDITVEEVRRDKPGDRTRILTAESETWGLPKSGGDRRGASVQKSEILRNRDRLEAVSTVEPLYFSDNASINTRAVVTYDTDYSRVVREIFKAVQAEMSLRGKQKPGPVVSTDGNDNSAVRAVLEYPKSLDSFDGVFAHLEVQYWCRGGSKVRVKTHPLYRVYDEHDPSLSGPIEAISEPGIHVLLGKTMELALRFLGDNQDMRGA